MKKKTSERSVGSTSTLTSPKSAQQSKKNELRWYLFILISVTSIGHYICIALPSSLEKHFHSNAYGFTHTQTSTFSSVSMLPAIICAMIGGVLSDKFGVAKCRFYFILMTTAGQMAVSLACYYRSYPLMITGRIFYGIFSEGYQVASGAIILKYFKNAEIFLSMAALSSIGRAATSLTYWVTPKLMNLFLKTTKVEESITIIMLLSMMSLVIGTISALMVWMIDEAKFEDTKQQKTKTLNEDNIISAIKQFGFSYWILVFCVIPFTYIVTWGWAYLGPKYLEIRFDLSDTDSGEIMSIFPLVPAFLGPLIAWFVDLKGMREPLMILGAILLISAHFGFWLIKQSGYLACVIILSIGFSIAPAIVWSSFGLMIDEKYNGKAMGIAVGINSAALFVSPIIAGKLVDLAGSDVDDHIKYQNAEIMWIVCGMINLLGTFGWCWLLSKKKCIHKQ